MKITKLYSTDMNIYKKYNLSNKEIATQIVMFWEIDGISRGCLQELARHRTARLTVQSTRYILHKQLKTEPYVVYQTAEKYLVYTGRENIDRYSVIALQNVQKLIKGGGSNDEIKLALPESFKTKLQWQIDMRNFQQFLKLRTSKDAHWEIRKLAYELYDSLPNDYQNLCIDYLQ